jgi:hypothetical protein
MSRPAATSYVEHGKRYGEHRDHGEATDEEHARVHRDQPQIRHQTEPSSASTNGPRHSTQVLGRGRAITAAELPPSSGSGCSAGGTIRSSTSGLSSRGGRSCRYVAMYGTVPEIASACNVSN